MKLYLGYSINRYRCNQLVQLTFQNYKVLLAENLIFLPKTMLKTNLSLEPVRFVQQKLNKKLIRICVPQP